jgi:very-short-patch-repair endonuclease
VPSDLQLHDEVDDTTIGELCGHYATLNFQVALLTYVADFVLTANGGLRLVVECDGHDFHDRTKQQAAYDRARDRELLAIGIRTIRFTGSEIHHSAERCAQETWRIFALVLKDDEAPVADWQGGFEAGVQSVLNSKKPAGRI